MNWLIALGIGVPLAAASVPVIIHLINLTRYRKIDWAAMEFLLAAYRKTRRRLQMESLVMLLLRVAAIIFLALAFFPFAAEEVKAWFNNVVGFQRSTFSGNAPLHLVIVLDNSASMGYTQEGQSAFDRAKKYALSLVDDLKPNRDRVTIVRMSDVFVPRGLGGVIRSDDVQVKARRERVKNLSNLDLETARKELAATTIAAVDTNALVALQEAHRLMDLTPETDAAGLVVITDFANTGWRELSKDGAKNGEFADILTKINERMEKAGGLPVFYDAGFDDSSNLAITDFSCETRVVGDGMEAKIVIKISNYSRGSEVKNVSLVYRIDGKDTRPAGKVQVAANQTTDPLVMTLKPGELKLNGEKEKKLGASRQIEVEITEPDGLKADNRRSLVINVVPNVPILVVNGVPDKDPRLDETFYLETALSISETDGKNESRVTPNRIVAITPAQLTAQESFLDYRVVILANVPSLPESTVRKLEEFVTAGFGLIIFDGDRVDHQRYNRDLYNEGKGLLPCLLKSPEGSSDKVVAPRYKLLAVEKDHPAISMFTRSDTAVSMITDPQVIFNWRGVELPKGAQADPLRPVNVLLGVNKGSNPPPYMISRRFGRGNVIYFAGTAGERWNELWNASNGLPLWLYHETVNYLANSEARYSNLTVGEPYRRVLRVKDVAPVYQIKDPGGTTADVPSTIEDGQPMIEWLGTAAAGVYTLTALERADNGQLSVKWQERFSVSTEPRESDVVKIATEDRSGEKSGAEAALREALGEIKFAFQKAGGDQDGKSLTADDTGGNMWMWFAAIAALFFLMESAWSMVISKPEQ